LAEPNEEHGDDRDADEKQQQPESPQMKLNLEFNDEPLFPLNFLKSDSPLSSRRATGSTPAAAASEARSSAVNGTAGHVQEEDTAVDEGAEEDEDEDDDASSSEAVIANLEAMDVSNHQCLFHFHIHISTSNLDQATAFINVIGSDNHEHVSFRYAYNICSSG
jgi:hypothetical protein